MKTCIIAQEGSRLWEDCKNILTDLDYQIVQENFKTGKMSACRSISPDFNTVILELSIKEQSQLLVISVDAVQNNSIDGMFCSQPSFEIIFITELLRTRTSTSDENAFKIKEEDYIY